MMQNFSDGKVPVFDNRAASLFNLAKKELRHLYDEQELEQIAWWILEQYTQINKAKLLIEPNVHVNQSSLIYFSNALPRYRNLGIIFPFTSTFSTNIAKGRTHNES